MSNLLQLFYTNLIAMDIRGVLLSGCLSVPMFLTFNVSAANIFTDDMESGDFTHQDNNARWGSKANVTVSTQKPRTGSHSLRFFFEGKADEQDAFSELRFKLGGNYSDIWIRYDLFVPTNYYHRDQASSTNNKFIYLWSGDYSAGFTGPGLSVQNWESNVGESNAIPKAKGAPASSGGFLFDKHYTSDGGTIFDAADHGKWLTIVIHAKYATASNNDGVFQLWKIRDGQTIEIFNKTNGNWYVPGQPGFDEGYLLGWANSGFDQDVVFYMDNVEFSTTPLLDGIVAAPRPPTIIQ